MEEDVDRTGIVTGYHTRSKRELARTLRKDATTVEKIVWEKLRAGRLGGFHFRRQQVIDGFIADFYCHAAGLIIELDGEIHTKQVEYDRLRDHILTHRNLYLLRIPNERVENELDTVLTEILILRSKSLGPHPTKQ